MTTNAAQSAINARIDSLLESMPPVARQRQSDDLDVTVPLWAVRSVMDEVETLRGALRAVKDWMDVPIDSDGGGFRELDDILASVVIPPDADGSAS